MGEEEVLSFGIFETEKRLLQRCENGNQGSARGIESEPWRKENQIGARLPGRLLFGRSARRCRDMSTLPLWVGASLGSRQRRGWRGWLERRPFCCWKLSASVTEPADAREAWRWHKRLRAICRDWEMCCAATGKLCATCARTLSCNCPECGKLRATKNLWKAKNSIP